MWFQAGGKGGDGYVIITKFANVSSGERCGSGGTCDLGTVTSACFAPYFPTSQLHPTPNAPRYVLYAVPAYAYWMLIGACNPLV